MFAAVPVIYDDFVRITPSDRTLIIDILANDDLGGHAVGDITVSLLVQPAVGAARVLPADPRAVAGSVNSRPRVEYRSAGPVAAGSEVQVYYSVAVTGEKDVPAPGTVTILGASEYSRADCFACVTLQSTLAQHGQLNDLCMQASRFQCWYTANV